jgi:hypothetical protein
MMVRLNELSIKWPVCLGCSNARASAAQYVDEQGVPAIKTHRNTTKRDVAQQLLA